MVLALLVLKTSALARLRHDLIMALANSLALLGTRLRGIAKARTVLRSCAKRVAHYVRLYECAR